MYSSHLVTLNLRSWGIKIRTMNSPNIMEIDSDTASNIEFLSHCLLDDLCFWFIFVSLVSYRIQHKTGWHDEYLTQWPGLDMPGVRCITTRRAPESSLQLTFLSCFIEHFSIQGSGHPVKTTICIYYTIYTAQLQNMLEKPRYSSHLVTWISGPQSLFFIAGF